MPSGHHIPNHKLKDIATAFLDLHMTLEVILETFLRETQVSHPPSPLFVKTAAVCDHYDSHIRDLKSRGDLSLIASSQYRPHNATEGTADAIVCAINHPVAVPAAVTQKLFATPSVSKDKQ